MTDIPVDIVIPVYGAPEHLERCVDSVLRNTDHPQARVILSDDASPDGSVDELLNRYAADQRVTVLRSDQNRGFVRTCNAAMRGSTSDVVLLNSDTRVGPGWLWRLQRYAYLLDRVGSVTPLSNNAEVCSAPMWFEKNRYPGRVGIDELDHAAAEEATYAPIELPTGVGFCLYLRRTALDQVGLFDEQAFNRGYGEENDLCVRMRHNGYLNLLADGVFVEHFGKASFGESGELLQNLEAMWTRWPGYRAAIADYRANDPLHGVRSRLGYRLIATHRDPGAVRPLYVLHYRTRIGRKGGTEHQTQDLIDAAGQSLDPLILTYERGEPVAQWDADAAGMSFPPDTTDEETDSSWISRLLDTGVDLVHVQQAMRVPLPVMEELQAQARTRGLAVIWTLHDFSTTCPCTQLVHPDGEPCPSRSKRFCEACEQLSMQTDRIGLTERRERYASMVNSADLLIVPSHSAAEIQTSLLELDSRPRVIPHGIAGRALPISPPRRKRPVGVILGYSAPQKGSEFARSLIDKLANSIDWVFLGRDHLPGMRRRRNVRFAGSYERDELQAKLEELRPDAVFLLSNWPETYLYTLSEAWRSGLPVFGTDVGAMGERIRATNAGVLLDPDDVEGSVQTIDEAIHDPQKMASLREAAARAGSDLPSLDSMAETYLGLYRRLVGQRVRPPSLTQADTTPEEWAGWIGSHPVPFPAEAAFPVRVS